MKQALDLSRLPKAAIGFPKSLNKRSTTPAFSLPGRIADRKYAVDPTHPSTVLPLRAFPHYTCYAFSIRAVPKAAMINDEWQPPPPILKEHHKREDQLDISLFFKTFINLTHKRTTLRRQITRKLHAAISLVLTRSAGVNVVQEDLPGCSSGSHPISKSTRGLTFDLNPTVPALKDWTYIITPNREVYRMSYADLITDIRKSFSCIYSKATQMEKTWTYQLNFEPPGKLAQVSAFHEANQEESERLRVVPMSIRTSPSERSPLLGRNRHSGQFQSWVTPEKVDHSLPLPAPLVQGSLYTPIRYPRRTALFSRLSRKQEKSKQEFAGPVQQRLDSLPMFPDRNSFVAQSRWPKLSEAPKTGVDYAAPPRRKVEPVFPSEAPAPLRVPGEVVSPGNGSLHRDVMLTKPICPAQPSEEVEFVPESKGMQPKGSLASHLDLPDRFAGLSWREFDDSDEAQVGKSRTTSKSHAASTPGMTASRTTLTTPKPDGEVCEDAVATVTSRIFTTKPIFLDPRSMNPTSKCKAK